MSLDRFFSHYFDTYLNTFSLFFFEATKIIGIRSIHMSCKERFVLSHKRMQPWINMRRGEQRERKSNAPIDLCLFSLYQSIIQNQII